MLLEQKLIYQDLEIGLYQLLKILRKPQFKVIPQKTFVGGLISGEGSATLIYDNAGNSDYLAFVEDVLTTGDAADALFELFPDSSASSKKFGFSGIITNAEYGATLGEIQEINITFQTSGAITSDI